MKIAKIILHGFLGFILTISTVLAIIAPVNAVEAVCDYAYLESQNNAYWDPCDTDTCSIGDSIASTKTNKDYAGKDILNAEQLKTVSSQKPIYEKAAKESGVPWEVIAVLHLRETNLKKSNPANGQGIYQDAAKVNGPYPTGAVDDEEFLRQSIWAGNFIKGKVSNPSKLASGDIEQIKDAFFGYNGRAQVYVDQAIKLGYTKEQGYEGSPYVMNRADKDRDPAINKTTWGQIRTDGGSIQYPATNAPGAFIVYASLAGLSLGGSCGVSGALGERIAQIAEAEYALWQSGAMKPGYRSNDGSSFSKYTQNGSYEWCAMFVSWVLIQAGHPIVGGNRGNYESLAVGFNTPSKMEKTGFVIHNHANNYGGYTPKRGDIVVYEWSDSGLHHVNIITGYDAATNKITTIGGNEGKIPLTSSYVRQHTRSLSDRQIMSITEVR